MRFCQSYAGSNPVSDQFPFKLRNGSKDSEDQPSVWRRSIHPLMQTDEINPEGPEFFERIDQLAQTACEPVVAVYHNTIHCSAPTIGEQLIQCRPVFFRSADALINVLTNYSHLSPSAVLPDFL